MRFFDWTGNFFREGCYGIYRWHELNNKAGMYRLVWSPSFLPFIGEHMNCIVDDFGTLVVVPS